MSVIYPAQTLKENVVRWIKASPLGQGLGSPGLLQPNHYCFSSQTKLIHKEVLIYIDDCRKEKAGISFPFENTFIRCTVPHVASRTSSVRSNGLNHYSFPDGTNFPLPLRRSMVLILRKQPIFHFFWMTTPPLTPTLRRYLFNPRKGYHSRGDGLLPFFLKFPPQVRSPH